MKCPLFKDWNAADSGVFYYTNSDCLKEECAWWDTAHETCAVIALNQTFVAVGNVLSKLTDVVHCDVQLRR